MFQPYKVSSDEYEPKSHINSADRLQKYNSIFDLLNFLAEKIPTNKIANTPSRKRKSCKYFIFIFKQKQARHDDDISTIKRFLTQLFKVIYAEKRRWPSGRVLTYRAQGHGFLKTVKIGTRCHPAKHSALKGMIEGKWCKNQG